MSQPPPYQTEPLPSGQRLAQQRKALRQALRAKRRALKPHQQHQASIELTRLVSRQPAFLRAKRIAMYIANDGEIDPGLLLKRALGMNKQCFLPTLHPHRAGYLWFAPYDLQSSLQRNRFGIPEPRGTANKIISQTLDMVLVPLVGFDRLGQRLGMGGGFYDRTFAFKSDLAAGQKPLLVGLAHDCQEVDELPIQSWDIPLDAIITDRSVIPCSGLADHHFVAKGRARRR